MRYESFYPFSGNQSPPPMQQVPGTNSFTGAAQHSGQPSQFGMPQNTSYAPYPEPSMQGPGPGSEQDTSKIDGYMQTANRFLNTAQQFAPVVQQFAPMMRNLPTMWKLYKGFQAMPSATDSSIGAATASAAEAPVSSPVPSSSAPRIFQPDR